MDMDVVTMVVTTDILTHPDTDMVVTMATHTDIVDTMEVTHTDTEDTTADS